MKNNRTFALGDIHGRHKALQQVLQRSGFNNETDTLIFLGDIVDRGSEPLECIEELLEIKNLISITGNHDINFYTWLKTGRDYFYGKDGVAITKEKWNVEKDEDRKRHCLSYFEKMVYYHIDDHNRIFVHGGFDHRILITEQNEIEFCWDRSLWEDYALVLGGSKKIQTIENFLEIYIGHTPTIQYVPKVELIINGHVLPIGEPINYPFLMGGILNMDTGAGFGMGKLSMIDINSKEIFQSDKIEDIYGPE